MFDEQKLTKLYFKDVQRYKLLSKEEEAELITEWQERGDRNSLNKLISSNLKFVAGRARKYSGYINGGSITMFDLIQEGNRGLIAAARKFDVKRNFKFVSYAVHWVDAYMTHYVIDNMSQIKLGTSKAERYLFYKRNELDKINSADISEKAKENRKKKIAKKLKISYQSVIDTEKKFYQLSNIISFDKPQKLGNDDDGATTYYDWVPSESNNDEAEEIEKYHGLKESVLASVKHLTDKEKFIIKERYFSDGIRNKTFQEIANQFGVSREWIRQIEVRALKKMKLRLQDDQFVQETLNLN